MAEQSILRRASVAVGAAALLAIGASILDSTVAEAANHKVELYQPDPNSSNIEFRPSSLSIKIGDTITFYDKDGHGGRHPLASSPGPENGGFDLDSDNTCNTEAGAYKEDCLNDETPQTARFTKAGAYRVYDKYESTGESDCGNQDWACRDQVARQRVDSGENTEVLKVTVIADPPPTVATSPTTTRGGNGDLSTTSSTTATTAPVVTSPTDAAGVTTTVGASGESATSTTLTATGVTVNNDDGGGGSGLLIGGLAVVVIGAATAGALYLRSRRA